MTRLRQSDLESALGYVREISSFTDLAAFRAGILPGLTRLVPCDLVAYNELDPTSRAWEYDAVWAGGGSPRPNRAAFVRFMDQHPLLPYYERGGDPPTMQFADVVSARDLHRLDLYQEFYRPLEIEHQIVLQLPATLPRVIGVPLMRARGSFSERDRTLLELLRPHMVGSYLDSIARTRLRRALDAHEEGAAGRERTAALVLGRDDEIHLATGAGERLLERYFERAERGGRLPDELAAWVRRERGRLNGTSVPDPAWTFVRERGDRVLSLRFLSGTGATEPDAVLIREERRRLSPAALGALALTRREGEVLARAAHGGSYAEIGADLFISAGTVHKHLEHIYAKLGVSSRAAAVTEAYERLAAVPTG